MSLTQRTSRVLPSSLACIIFVPLSFTAIARANPIAGNWRFQPASPVIRSQACKVDGDSDIYGLGVRLGLYLQWLSGFILRNIGSWETMTTVRTTNNTLCIALASATMINIVDSTALSIDYLLSYYLTVILFYAESYNLRLEVGETAPRETDYYTLAPDPSLLIQNLFFALYSLFGAWYWLAGIDQSRGSPCPQDAAIILLFNLHSHRWKIAATVFAIALGGFWTVVAVINFLGLVSTKGKRPGPIITAAFRAFNSVCGFDNGLSADYTPVPQEIGQRFKRPLWRNPFHYMWLYLLGPFLAIVSVERIIASNRLETAAIKSSTGQMISLVAGIASMLCALWELGFWLDEKEVSLFRRFHRARPRGSSTRARGSSHRRRRRRRRRRSIPPPIDNLQQGL